MTPTSYFDDYYEYRMMYALRIYTTHHGPAITSYVISYNEKKEAYIRVIVKPEELLSNYSDFNRIIKSELQKMMDEDKEIEIFDLVDGFKSMLPLFNKDLFKAIEKEAQAVLIKFDKYLTYEDGNAIDSYILDENDNIIENITNSLKWFMKKMCNPY